MTDVNRGMPAKVMEVRTERIPASGMARGVQSEMDGGIAMVIEVGPQGTINTGNREGSGDGRGRDRGLWMQGMAEMKSDVAWFDTPVCMSFHPFIPDIR